MKRIFFHRKSLLRAIRAACLALFLAATTAARAQTAMGSNGNVTISGSGTQYVYNGTNPTLSPTGTLTISVGSTISDTGPNPNVVNIQQGATIKNSGTLSVNFSGGGLPTVTPILYNASSSQAVTVTNSGSLSGITQVTAYSASGLYVTNEGSGGATVTNSGSVYGGSSQTAYGVFVSTGGNVSLTNSKTGTIGANGEVTTGLSAQSVETSTVLNQGSITVTGSGEYGSEGIRGIGETGVNLNNTGTISVVVSGGAAFGVNAAGENSASTMVTNSNAITVTGDAAFGIASGSSGSNTVINSGTINANSNVLGGRSFGIIAYGSFVPVSVSNSSTINSTSLSSASGIYVSHVNGPISITDSGSITAASTTGTGQVTAIYASGNVGAATIELTGGSLSSTQSSGYFSARGVQALTGSGNISITSTSTPITASGYYTAIGVDAESSAGGSITITNGGAIASTSTGTAGGEESTPSPASGLFAQTSGAITITNSGTLMATTGFGNAYGIQGDSSNGLSTISNTGAITVSAPGDEGARGIFVDGNAGAVTNSGHITASGNNLTYGIDVDTANNSTVINTSAGTISVTSGATSNLYGIFSSSGYGTAQVSNAAGITVVTTHESDSGYSYAIRAAGITSSVQNSGALVCTSGSSAYAIEAFGGQVTVTNSNSIHAAASAGESDGIFAQGNSVTVANSGALTVSASGRYGEGIDASGNLTAVTNSGALVVSSNGGVQAIFSGSSYGSTVVNRASITATSNGYNSLGIGSLTSDNTASATNSGTINVHGVEGTGVEAASTNGDAIIANTGNVTVVATNNAAYGLNASAPNGNATVTNSAAIHATTTGSSVYGIYSSTSGGTGNVTVANSGAITVTGGGGEPPVDGIAALASSGDVTVDNSGTILATATLGNGAGGIGIFVDPNGPVIVNNTGSVTGTTSGIYLTSAGTVNNHGLASGGTYSIFVPTGSTVNLDGASPIKGLLKGGANASSTSTLDFNLVIRGNYAAEKMSLDDAIAAYAAAYTAAAGVGNVDSSVVVLNGIDYKWEDFLDVIDNLVEGRAYGMTPGYQGIGTAIDNFNTGTRRGAAILNGLDNLPASDVANALAQLSPQSLQVFRNIGFDNAGFTAANVNNHLANLRDGLTGFDTSGFTVNAPGVDPTLTQVRSRLLAWNPAPVDPGLVSDSTSSLIGGVDMKDTKAMLNTQPVDRWSAFISGSVILANLDNTMSNIGDSNYTTGSILAGADYRFGNHLTVGALFNYAHTGADLDGNGSRARVDTYAPGIYASYVNKGWYGNAMLMYGFNSNSESRHITVPGLEGTNNGSSDGGQVTANETAGYEFQRGNFKFGPVASLQYVHLTVGSFQEDGSTSLSIDRQEDDSLRSQLGFEVRYNAIVPTCLGSVDLTPHFQASWQHEYMDNSDGITSQFNSGAGGGSFVVQGQQPERDAAFLDLGLDAQVANNVTLFIDYQTQAGQNNFSAQSAQGGVRIGF